MGNSISDRIDVNVIPFLNGLIFDLLHCINTLVSNKYYAEENIIWLVEEKGVYLPTLIHELLHSIQKCNPNRENIVDFLFYKMLDNVNSVDQKVVKEWYEIEKVVGLKAIKERLLLKGDCEDF